MVIGPAVLMPGVMLMLFGSGPGLSVVGGSNGMPRGSSGIEFESQTSVKAGLQRDQGRNKALEALAPMAMHNVSPSMATYVGPHGANMTSRVRQFENYARMNVSKAVHTHYDPWGGVEVPSSAAQCPKAKKLMGGKSMVVFHHAYPFSGSIDTSSTACYANHTLATEASEAAFKTPSMDAPGRQVNKAYGELSGSAAISETYSGVISLVRPSLRTAFVGHLAEWFLTVAGEPAGFHQDSHFAIPRDDHLPYLATTWVDDMAIKTNKISHALSLKLWWEAYVHTYGHFNETDWLDDIDGIDYDDCDDCDDDRTGGLATAPPPIMSMGSSTLLGPEPAR